MAAMNTKPGLSRQATGPATQRRQLTASVDIDNPFDGPESTAIRSPQVERAFDIGVSWDFTGHVENGEIPDVLQPQPVNLNEVLDGYQPDTVTPAVWARIEPAVRTIMEQAAMPCTNQLYTDRWVITRYCYAAVSDGFFNPNREPIPPLTRQHIDHFLTNHCTDLTRRSRSNIFSRLCQYGTAINPDDWPRERPHQGDHEASQPYSPTEVRQLLDHAQHLADTTGDLRHQCILGCTLGAGVSDTDYRYLPIANIYVRDGIGIVDIEGRRPRRVPIHHAYEPLALNTAQQLAEQRPGQLVVGGTDTSRKQPLGKVVTRFNKTSGVRLDIKRARSTWLLDLMDRGVHIKTIQQACGTSQVHTVERLMPYAADRPATEVIEELRGQLP